MGGGGGAMGGIGGDGGGKLSSQEMDGRRSVSAHLMPIKVYTSVLEAGAARRNVQLPPLKNSAKGSAETACACHTERNEAGTLP